MDPATCLDPEPLAAMHEGPLWAPQLMRGFSPQRGSGPPLPGDLGFPSPDLTRPLHSDPLHP